MYNMSNQNVDAHLSTTSVGLNGYNTKFVADLADKHGINREQVANLLLDYMRCVTWLKDANAYIKHNKE